MDRCRAPEPRPGVCDRIEALTVVFAEQPPTFAPAIEAGIIASVERQIRADEQLFGTQKDRP